jgi:hypothetical protein
MALLLQQRPLARDFCAQRFIRSSAHIYKRSLPYGYRTGFVLPRGGMSMSCHRSLVLIAAGLLLLPAIASSTPLSPFIDLQEKGLTLASTGAGTEHLGSGSASLSVTINGPVRFALLYWVGRQRPCDMDGGGNCVIPAEPYRDQQVVFDGNALTGTIIGTESQPVSGGGPIMNVGYFADVTSIVAAKGTGTQAFSFSDGDLSNNLWRKDGVSLVVAYTDPAELNTYRVLVWDGLDFAFGIDPTPGDNRVTAPAAINHGINFADRSADLHIGVGDCVANRPDRVDISNNPSVVNGMTSSAGDMYDNKVLPITIPSGVGVTSVQLLSTPNNNPDSMLWVYAALRVRQLDTARVKCPITLNEPGPPARVEVTFSDGGTGISELVVTKSENADSVVPPFTPGTKDLVVMSSTKIDQTKRARVEVRASDLAGNVALCDPILGFISRGDDKAEVQTYDDVPREEHVLTIYNGKSGFKKLEVTVNGKALKLKDLDDGETRSIDLAKAMHPGDNTVSFKASGKKGATLNLMLWDGVSE